jgi:uncharacterized protein (DUF1501 family)
MNSRRDFIKKTATAGVGIALAPHFTFGMNPNADNYGSG